MKALVIEKPNNLSLQEVDIPKIKKDEILLKVKAGGLCGTDLHILKGHHINKFPIIPCHEFAGEVAGIGSDVNNISIGSKVAIFPAEDCGECYYCKNDLTIHCEQKKAYGVLLPGGFAQYVAVKAKYAYNIDNMPYEFGALAEPLGCVMYSFIKCDIKSARNAIVFGCGSIGAMFIQVLSRYLKVENIVSVDIKIEKLETAKENGATDTFLSDENLETNIIEKYPYGFDLIIDATGVIPVIKSLYTYASKQAKIVCFGLAPQDAIIEVKPYSLFDKDLSIYGSCTSSQESYELAIELLKSTIDMNKIISNTYSLDNVIDAFNDFDTGKIRAKAIININNEN